MVKPLMEKYLKNLPIDIYIYLSDYSTGKKEFEDIDNMEQWLHENVLAMPYVEFKEELLKDYPNIIYDDMDIKGDNAVISDEQLSDFWEYLRSGNIVEVDNLPFGLRKIRDILVNFLKQTNYIKEVKINNEYGLMLLPKTKGETKVMQFK
jgi:hypothetical protein